MKLGLFAGSVPEGGLAQAGLWCPVAAKDQRFGG
jgi:hypothetical protein